MNRKPLIAAGVLLGIGLGGFLDGIVFHQITQVHSMLSATLPQNNLLNVKVSMVWDGLFHALTWITTLTGLVMLFHAGKVRDCPWSGTVLWGAAILGWGLFNMVEGIVDHHLLGIHHVVERLGHSVYDYLFTGSGMLLLLLGIFIIRSDKQQQKHSPAPAFR